MYDTYICTEFDLFVVYIHLGHVQRSREKPDPKTMRGPGHGFGSRQAVLPRPGPGPQENVSGQEPRAAEFALCLIAVHTDDRHPHQNICQHPDLTGPALPGGHGRGGVHTGGPVHPPWDRGTQGHHQR